MHCVCVARFRYFNTLTPDDASTFHFPGVSLQALQWLVQRRNIKLLGSPLCPSAYLSVRLSVCLSVRLPTCLPTCLSVCLPVCLSAYLSVRLPTCLSVCLPVCLSAYLSVCLSTCVSVCSWPSPSPPPPPPPQPSLHTRVHTQAVCLSVPA